MSLGGATVVVVGAAGAGEDVEAGAGATGAARAAAARTAASGAQNGGSCVLRRREVDAKSAPEQRKLEFTSFICRFRQIESLVFR